MKTLAATLAAFLTLAATSYRVTADTFGTGANTFEIEFVEIGDAGNPPHMTDDILGMVGSVDHVFSIGKYEIPRDEVAKANADGNLGITLDPLDVVTGGPRPDMPATGVSWNEVARFVNWLNTGRGFSAAYKFDLQPGVEGYDSNANIVLWNQDDPGFDASNPFRNSLAVYFLPSLDEWHKAAYYDPSANDGMGGYWSYPTGSDTAPTPVARGSEEGQAVYAQAVEQGPADITRAGGLSPYGVMALGGNAHELQETHPFTDDNPESIRGSRGGWWDTPLNGFLSAPNVEFDSPMDSSRSIGFRIASIPEPSSLLLGALGALGLLLRRRSIA